MINLYQEMLSYKKISESVLFKKEYKDISRAKKIAIFSAFVRTGEEFNYHDKIYTWLKSNGYFVILVIPVVSDLYIDEGEYLKSCDFLIMRTNFGYDFGSYATGLQCIKNFQYLDSLLFVNDSSVGPFGSANIIEDKADFWSNTDSYQIKYHYQSYLFGFKISEVSIPAIVEFFFGRGDIYTNEKDKVICNFELAMYDFFYSKGLSCKAIYSEKELKNAFLKRINSYFRSPELISKIKYYIVVMLIDANPTHHLWLELFTSGYPFLKKELVRDNPTNYPSLNQKVQHEMEKLGCAVEYKKIFKEHI
jgi:hypothetical protein